ncbi:MAG: type II and III secretion system protein [Desulfotalea sp.]|nr:MAG: type II and III secretion system protein [Desulfotalea sp.]
MNLQKQILPSHAACIAAFCLTLFSCASVYGISTTPIEAQADHFTDRASFEFKNVIIDELEFKKARVQDAVRVLSELSGVNIVATEESGQEVVSLFVRRLTVENIIDTICRISGLWYRYNAESGIFIVMTTEEYQKDMVVFRREPTRMFKLKYLNVGIAARTIADLFGDRVELLGKANRHYGDDFIVGSTYSNFGQWYDKAEMESDDSDSDSDNDNSDNKDSTKKRDEIMAGKKLTSGQIGLLEQLTKNQVQTLTEGMISQVSQMKEATIYVTVNRLHNMLFVRTSDEKAMTQIAKIIASSDQQVPEVLLEMKVLEVQLTDQFESAFDISNLSGTTETGPADGHAINPLTLRQATAKSSIIGMGNFGLMKSSTMVFQALSSNIRVRLQLLQANNNITALATPMLLAANNHPAKLFIGEQVVITTGFKAQEIEITSGTNVIIQTTPVPITKVTRVGNTLTILPSINADRSVVMRLVHENSSVNKGGGTIPLLVGDTVQNVVIDTINTSTLEGTVLAQDGMTVAVGGMMRTSTVKQESKVPILGDIPLLGFFFKKVFEREVKTELVLLITPHILTAPSDGEALTRNRLSALLDHPSPLHTYLDEMPEQRASIQRQRLSATIIGDDIQHQAEDLPPVAAQEPITNLNGLEKSYIELIRVAAKQVRTPFLLRQPEGHITPISLLALGQPQIFKDRALITSPEASWSNGIHYVTALKVINRSNKKTAIDVGKMFQPWQAATLEQQQLAPAGEKGDSTYLYLISEEKFEKAIAREEQ